MANDSMKWVRPAIREMFAYTPGEQPREPGIIKLNTNENPYPPSPRVFEALKAAVDGDILRKYPDPRGMQFCLAAGKALNIDPDSILIGNGSDDVLTILTRSCVPENGLAVSLSPSYLLYKTLAEIQGARFATVSFAPGWKLPHPWPQVDANLTFLANPNSPSGTVVEEAVVLKLAQSLPGALVVDEAYADFAQSNCVTLFQQGRAPENLIITRTLSKSYSLAGIRFGFAVASPALIREFLKVKDSYNCDALSLAAASAAISDQDYLRQTREKILATRARLEASLAELGFLVTPSQGNFVWCRHPVHDSTSIHLELKNQRILVRLMGYPEEKGLRISVGSDLEIDRLLEVLQSIVQEKGK
ncbi:MAG: histidinol-phosphate transaminase [Gemmataceae bacterium]|nr:histidinol-phosphate transaminase [Gemmataceae bacterium]